jgi:nucleoside-diphosphate-sugar epimerase
MFIYSYAGADGEIVTEMSPTDDPESSPRVAKLVHAEAVCLKSGGCCLRLAGLYTLERGAHSYWLKSGKEIQGRKDGIINLLHYDDAAGACLAALKVGATVTASRVFLVSDGNPTTRRGIVDSALKSKLFSGMADPGFLGTKGEGDAMGKIYDGSFTNQALKWKPRYPSFDHFMSTQ